MSGTVVSGRRNDALDEPEAWLTKGELAAHLGCSTRTIERLALPLMRVGGQNRYRLSEVESHLRGSSRRAQLIPLPTDRGKESAA